MKTEGKAYSRVAAELRERILGNSLKPQQQLPTEADLSAEFGVSRITVRRALEILEEEHLIHKRQGKGSFVSPSPSRRIPLLIDYTGSVRSHAPNLRRLLRFWKWSPCPDWVSVELKIEAGETIYYCERADMLGETAVAFDRAYIVHAFADRLEDGELDRIDFNDYWQKRCAFEILSCKQMTEAVKADKTCAEILRLRRGDPVLRGIELYTTHEKRPTGLFDNYYHPEYISLVSNFPWTAGA